MKNVAGILTSNIHKIDQLLKKQVLRFLVAGCSAVFTDLCVYYALFSVAGHSLAKLLSFASGTVVSYMVNKYWTFESSKKSVTEIIAFILLYVSTMGANVFTHKMFLTVYPEAILAAFLVATGISTVLNFLGMRCWVFKKKDKSYEALNRCSLL